jgi:transmembrane sensor
MHVAGRIMSAGLRSSQRGNPAPMSPTPDFPTLQEAAEWFALLRAEDASGRDRQRWQIWLDAEPSHREAWRKVEAVNQQFNLLPGEVARDALTAKGTQRRKLAKRLALLCLATSAGGLLATRAPRGYLASLNAQYRTDVGATRKIVLADGSLMWLNTASAADVDFTDDLRRIVVHTGEVLIETAADHQSPKRPLVVDVKDGRLRALGTRFTVRLNDEGTHLAVLQGAVSVEPADGTATRVIAAGNEVTFSGNRIGQPAVTDESRTAWSRNMLMPDNMRLADFLDELSRYRRGYIGCAPDVADLRLIGVYPLADTDRVLAALSASLPIKVRRILPWWISVEAI